MRVKWAITAVLATIGMQGNAFAQTINGNTTTNNGTGGIFLSLTPTTAPLTMSSFSTFFGSTAGTAVNVEVWTRPGAYAGFTTSSAGWTLTQTVTGVSAGTATASAPIVLTTPIDLPVATTSIYLHSITTGGGIRYFGTGTTSNTTFSNADLTLFSDIARTGAVSFGGAQNTPRAFSGSIVYAPTPVPEPGTLGLAGAASLGAMRGWRRLRRARNEG